MTKSTTPRPPTLDATAALRWHAQLRAAANAPWLHAEVAKRSLERLDYLKLADGPKLLWESAHAGLAAQQAFLVRFGKLQTRLVAAKTADFGCFDPGISAFIEFDATNIGFSDGGAVSALSWLRRQFSGSPSVQPAPLESGQAQLVWSNLLIHGHPQPQILMRQWFDALAVGGCAMFSALGVDTGRELRQVFADAGFGPAAAALTDMHDWGDMLIDAGFSNPVMDMEKLKLTYPSANALLADWRSFGRNGHTQRFEGLRTARWRETLLRRLESGLPRENGEMCMAVELAYGHAFKPSAKHTVSEMSAISMQDMRAMLRRKQPA